MAALLSTSATPALSHPCKAPICAAQMSGPVPPGPAPRISVLSTMPAPSAQRLQKDAANLLDDVVIDDARSWQIHAAACQRHAVGTSPGIGLVGRHGRQRMEEGAY